MEETKSKTTFAGLIRFEKDKLFYFIVIVLFSVLLAILAERAYTYLHGLLVIEAEVTREYPRFSLLTVYRIGILFCVLFFLLIHFIVKLPVFYEIVFKYRYIIAVSAFFILVINQIHFSSIGAHNFYIQPEVSTVFGTPVFGITRLIRSDEWAVTTPIQLSALYGPEAFGRYNLIARGTLTENMPNGMTFNLASFAFPFNVFYLLGPGYGLSARWAGLLILTFMTTFELMLVIAKKNRLLAVTGAFLITFSPFFQWWSYVMFIPTGVGALVCFNYFLKSENSLKRAFLSLGIIILLSMFIVNLYPAWQVPAGYLFLGLAIWLISENRDRIKKLKLTDYGMLIVIIGAVAAIVGTYLHESREYIAGISNTIYPGARVSTGGGSFSEFFNRMMNGGVFAPVSTFRVFTHTNICEFGGIYTLFPVPLIFSIFIMIRKKVFDLLSMILIIYFIFIGSYVTFGWPEWLARVTLMSHSAPNRAMDVLMFSQLILLVRTLAGYSDNIETITRGVTEKKMKYITIVCALIVGIILAMIALVYSRTTFANRIPEIYFVLPLIGFVLVLYSLFNTDRSKKMFTAACLFLIAWSCMIWISTHPVMKGTDAVHAKPLSAKITQLATDPDEKWISLQGVVGPAFLIANGASTVNSVNFYPNLDLWYELDPERVYEHIYNRYASITVNLTSDDTHFILLHADHVHINLSYSDLAVAGVKYIHSPGPIDDDLGISFTLLYNEYDAWIYSVDHNN